jgi:hydrogenase small subunit
MLSTLLYIVTNNKIPALDPIGRPEHLYRNLIHDKCERRKHFDNGQFIRAFGDDGTRKGWCWAMVGCRGPLAYAPCPTNKWNGGLSWCIDNGPCTGCSEPGFWDTLTPFYDRSPDVEHGPRRRHGDSAGRRGDRRRGNRRSRIRRRTSVVRRCRPAARRQRPPGR